MCYYVVESDNMYIIVNKEKVKINKLDTFSKRIKSLRFKLEPITEGYLFEKKRWINTYWFCQRTDIILTTKNNVVKHIYQNIGTEKIIFPKKNVYKVFIFPLGISEHIKINDKLAIVNKN